MTNWIKKDSLMYAIIVGTIIALLLFFATGQDGMGHEVKDSDFGHQSQDGMKYTYIELEVVGIDEHGVMFFDKTAPVEPNIFMSHEDIQHDKSTSKFQRREFEIGQIVTGEFDEEGWELFAVK